MREFVITMYLLWYKIIFSICKLFPLTEKVVLLASFHDNPRFIYRELKRQAIPVKIVFLASNPIAGVDAPTFNFNSLRGIFHLATAKQVIADNYYGFLAVTNFKKDVKVTQVWHAAGAIKQFGACDPDNRSRSKQANRRFRTVYRRFNFFVVGSKMMADIFRQAYLATDKQFLFTGVPRSDFFYNYSLHTQIKTDFLQANPTFSGKKIILYAPTFRRNDTQSGHLCLDVAKMKKKLAHNYVLVIKMHPAVKANFVTDEFVWDFSTLPINDLLVLADVLITDYSSLPMEFVLLDQPMIFYAYDLAVYAAEHGFWEVYDQATIPGPITTTTDEVVSAICSGDKELFALKRASYAKKWALYNNGNASAKLVEKLFNTNPCWKSDKVCEPNFFSTRK